MNNYIYKNINQFIKIFTVIFLALFVNSCGDPVPFDYVEKKYVEAYLIVGEPIKDIKVMKTLPLNVAFSYKESMIQNANVKITGDGREFTLLNSGDSVSGYYYPDTTYKVKPGTHYKIEIVYPDKSIVTGETNTPEESKWIKHVPDTIYYPQDTIHLPPLKGVELEWAKVPNIDYFLASIICLDTLNYGKYLPVKTNELNRRIYKGREHMRENPELTSWAVVPTLKIPVVWSIFKWYGLQEIIIYSPDYNYLKWFRQYAVSGTYDPLLSSINGGIGVFGSATAIRDTFFLMKNQP